MLAAFFVTTAKTGAGGTTNTVALWGNQTSTSFFATLLKMDGGLAVCYNTL